MPHSTREAWLEAACDALAPIIERATGGALERPRVSCGWAASSPQKTLGQCFMRDSAEDGRPQIFIAPTIKDVTAPQGVLATLLHEMCHAALPDKTHHKAPFKRLAEAVGLLEPWTATSAGEDLLPAFRLLAAKLGPYPHAALSLAERKKQSTRLLKCECQNCGYTARVTKKWIAEAGTPLCPCGNGPMLCEDNQESEGETV